MSLRRPPAPPPWAAQLFAVGITGTNGKSSTTTAVAALLGELARPVARMTTIGCYLDERRLDVRAHYDGFLTTMRQGLQQGGRYAAIELTSEALALGFAQSWPFRVGVFTNLSHDHSDAHGTPEHYLAAKAQLFMALPPGGSAVLNAGDPHSELIAEVVPAGVEIIRYAVPSSRTAEGTKADLCAHSVRIGMAGTSFELEGSPRFPELPRHGSIQALGEVFVENAVAALAAALLASVPPAAAVRALAALPPLAGRFELVCERPYVVVDYAHTPDALTRTLATARKLCAGRLTLVFGAGGNRDRAKRPLMGAAARSADRVVLTSDNPRDEDPRAIIAEIAVGVAHHDDVRCVPDRREAIEHAVSSAGGQDWVLIAGKGHEQEQESAGQKSAFSDVAIARAAHAASARTWPRNSVPG
ncbi:MAG TPA: UDP-N-acetylmuramyl-tripeptide synthetase [Polyangiaceae bacterium]|nr:UDP-N-acetylmuramyl-tripeptide synthetase [Polyangiaceae bacterium]